MRLFLLSFAGICACQAYSFEAAKTPDFSKNSCPPSLLTVRVGYELTYTPWKLAFTRNYFEKATNYTIKWVEITDTTKALAALDNGDLDLVIASSIEIARGISRQIKLKLVLIMETLKDSEALILKNDVKAKPSTVFRPRHLKGATIGTWWGSSQHYALQRFLRTASMPIMYNTRYQYNKTCNVPCFFKPQPDAVLIPKMKPSEVEAAWKQGKMDAAYVGYPLLYDFMKTGTVMLTNELLERWRMVTFNGLCVHENWINAAPHQCMTTNFTTRRDFLRHFILEAAKANYYYLNNTKEFVMTHKGAEGVNQKLAGVLRGERVRVAPHLAMYGYPTMQDQTKCLWLGCGARSRIAWALMDQVDFLLKLKPSLDPANISARNENFFNWRQEAGSGLDETLPSLEDFAKHIDTSFITESLARGGNGSYWLTLDDPAVPIQLGYGDVFVE